MDSLHYVAQVYKAFNDINAIKFTPVPVRLLNANEGMNF